MLFFFAYTKHYSHNERERLHIDNNKVSSEWKIKYKKNNNKILFVAELVRHALPHIVPDISTVLKNSQHSSTRRYQWKEKMTLECAALGVEQAKEYEERMNYNLHI